MMRHGVDTAFIRRCCPPRSDPLKVVHTGLRNAALTEAIASGERVSFADKYPIAGLKFPH